MITSDDRASTATIDPRGAARLPLTLHGQLITSHGPGNCIVEDISTTGARVRADVALEPGDAGILKCDELDILAEVRWRAGKTHGLTFAEPSEQHSDAEDDDFDDIDRRANNRRFFRFLRSQS